MRYWVVNPSKKYPPKFQGIFSLAKTGVGAILKIDPSGQLVVEADNLGEIEITETGAKLMEDALFSFDTLKIHT